MQGHHLAAASSGQAASQALKPGTNTTTDITSYYFCCPNKYKVAKWWLRPWKCNIKGQKMSVLREFIQSLFLYVIVNVVRFEDKQSEREVILVFFEQWDVKLLKQNRSKFAELSVLFRCLYNESLFQISYYLTVLREHLHQWHKDFWYLWESIRVFCIWCFFVTQASFDWILVKISSLKKHCKTASYRKKTNSWH